MAFDSEAGRLNGVYDFADAGIGPLHQEFIYSAFIDADLTERIVAAYERFSGRRLERRRIALLTAAHRLSELAELADEPRHLPDMLAGALDGLAWRRRRAWPDEGTRGRAGQDGYDRVRTFAAKYRYRSEIGLRARASAACGSSRTIR